ncbi:hypothetical protein KIV56_17750 [Cryobacterium breve]|uniref:Uncharacterized protein n=1 Tax=Cryobacterium breve TaxID=1259258 RepID=A0ABY7NEI9_9MICO|nr:hypothetical protein [Cryobacterium breve]WBM79973.1 hypothetical protein KIV56_17750 [Cryobacterium breve]
MGERVPRDAIKTRDRATVGTGIRHEGDTLGEVLLVEVDPSDVALGAALVPLEQVVDPAEDQVDVLVRLGLERLLRVLGEWAASGRVVAVVCDSAVRVGEWQLAVCHGALFEAGGENVVLDAEG